MNRNVKIITVAILAVLLGGGYFLLKSGRLGPGKHDYLAYYDNIEGLQPSSPVMIKGVRVGKISDIDLNGKGKVKVTITIGDEIRLPQGTVARLASGGIAGDRMLDLHLGEGPGFLASGSSLPTAIDTSLLPVSVRFTPMFETAKFLLKTTDTALSDLSVLFRTGFMRRTAIGMVNLEEKTRGMSRLAVSLNSGDVHGAISSFNAQTAELAANGHELSTSLTDASQSTAKMAKINIADNVASIQQSFRRIGSAFKTLDTSRTGWGGLLNSKRTYKSTSRSLDTLNRSLQEYYKNPPGMTLFGGGNDECK